MKRNVPLFLIIICIITIWYMYGEFIAGDKTAVAVSGEREDMISSPGILIRKEYPIKVDGKGFFQNNVATGSKVSKGQELGWYYRGTPDKELINKLNLVNEKLREATLTMGSDALLTNDTVAIDNKIAEYTKQISVLGAQGKQNEINQIRREIDLLIERKTNIANNVTGKKNLVVETLTAQKKELESKIGSNRSDIYSTEAGIFILGADGLEESLNPAAIETLTPATLEDIINTNEYKISDDVYPYPVCKVVDNSKWIVGVLCDESKKDILKNKKSVRVRFVDEGSTEMICNIEQISQPQDGKIAVFISGSKEFYHLYNGRKTNVEIIINSYSGLEVPTAAVKKESGIDVVNVLKGSIVETKQVKVLYMDDETAIIEEDNTKKDSLLLYDEVKLR